MLRLDALPRGWPIMFGIQLLSKMLVHAAVVAGQAEA
jgi:hypothetical protein